MFIMVKIKIPRFCFLFLENFSDFWALEIQSGFFNIYDQKNFFIQLLSYIFALLKFFWTKYQG